MVNGGSESICLTSQCVRGHSTCKNVLIGVGLLFPFHRPTTDPLPTLLTFVVALSQYTKVTQDGVIEECVRIEMKVLPVGHVSQLQYGRLGPHCHFVTGMVLLVCLTAVDLCVLAGRVIVFPRAAVQIIAAVLARVHHLSTFLVFDSGHTMIALHSVVDDKIDVWDAFFRLVKHDPVTALAIEAVDVPSGEAADLPRGTDEPVEPLSLLIGRPLTELQVQRVALLGPLGTEARRDKAALDERGVFGPV